MKVAASGSLWRLAASHDGKCYESCSHRRKAGWAHTDLFLYNGFPVPFIAMGDPP